MANVMRPTVVYINGYPGTGKLTVARALCALLPKAKLFDNHSLIDATSMIFERDMPEYQTLRRQMRKLVLSSIAASESTKDVTWIFTDQQSSSENGSLSARDYAEAAATRGSPFVSIILNCELEENIRRLSNPLRVSTTTKLNDVNILRTIRKMEDIFHFGGEQELEIDVTNKSETLVAMDIKSFLATSTMTPTAYTPVALGLAKFQDIPGFKKVFIREVKATMLGRNVEDLLCWLKSKPRHHGKLIFCDVVDSTGTLQAVFHPQALQTDVSAVAKLVPETSLRLTGMINATSKGGGVELNISGFSVVSPAMRYLTPPVRFCDPAVLSSNLLSFRHIYLRNPILSTLNNFRSKAFYSIRVWFERHGFIDFSAPLITPSLLYEPSSAIHIANLKNQNPLYLSQCAGFYLEAGAHAHERVYNLGPSFRNESRTNWHLMEYWHIKAEICSGDMNDIIQLVEIFLRDLWSDIRQHGEEVRDLLESATEFDIVVPFQRMTYKEAVVKLQQGGFDIEFGANIGKVHEEWLTKYVDERPLWITNKPKSLEPFPYCLDRQDSDLTMTADLIAPNGFGEICGVAEKSFDLQMLDDRLSEKGKNGVQPEYAWVRELREFGLVPHTAFGMGFERLLRWLCGNFHVKDNIPFPRIFGRHPLP